MLPVPQDRTSGRRSSSIGCRSIVGRRTSTYITSSTSCDPFKLIVEINSQVALFRDLLIHIGQSKDCPELREKVRKVRRSCVEACKHTSQLIITQIKSSIHDGMLADNPHLVLLYYLSQLFLRELFKSYRLIQVVPMDMSGYYDNRAGPSNLGNVISQILLCKQITPDFNAEELCSITKDSQDIAKLLSDMQEYIPNQETYLEKATAIDDVNGPWPAKRRRNSIYKNMGLLCCVSRPNYL
ncbi:uncharacterized protein LOC129566899 [Sitodiplosis mosellana]|uniref:uncharacterized protein LOC129566899 n=1 Tax=Sitodiplosis mosellana TaxID=263140 RepID=UPI00244516FF|nr:uncharacterized protein LOC129566899 [Sitodiplosis mosellana]